MDERIPDAELEVLAVVQRRGRATGREVREAIAGWRPLSHSSVMTLLKRLEERGLLRRERVLGGREYEYRATTTRDEAVRPILTRLLQRVYRGDAVGLAASLFETRRPSRAEIDRLKAMLDELSDEESDR